MVGINNLLLNTFLILLSIFVFYSVSEKFNLKFEHRRILICVLCSVTSILCMTFPFTVSTGHFYDLRIIPLLIGILYGGVGYGLFVTTIVFLFRYYLGGDGFTIVLMSFPIGLLFAFYFCLKFRGYKRTTKILISVFLNFVMVSTNLLLLVYRNIINHEQFVFMIQYVLIHIIAMCTTIYLIETMTENALMRQEMSRTEKNHVLGELAASFAHEIRNPMTVTQGFAQLLKERLEDEQNKLYMDMIIRETKRAQKIITDYLSFAKPQIEEIETVEVEELIRHSIGIMSSYAIFRNIVIGNDLESNLHISVDPQKLIQVIMNIVKNGIEAMPNGGSLIVRTYKSDKNIVIEISDTGIGMTHDEMKRLGNPFYTTKEKGTGLGMMVSYRIVEVMGGKIEVESKKGKGTKFTLIFQSA